MKKHQTILVGAVALGAAIGGLFLFSSSASVDHQTDTTTTSPSTVSSSTEALTAQERDGIVFMREEEKLAHDLYVALGKKWNLSVFTNIPTSEQLHMYTMGHLLDTYGIADPVTTHAAGVFMNKELQTLYDTLLAQGQKSLVDALNVGMIVEEHDIADLETYNNQTSHSAIKNAYDMLLQGSRNHLRAFYRQLTNRGESYTPRYISMQEFTAITTSDPERGAKQW